MNQHYFRTKDNLQRTRMIKEGNELQFNNNVVLKELLHRPTYILLPLLISNKEKHKGQMVFIQIYITHLTL
uniref:Uncharacterized protein n=1 Tax=Anguilla anguilla TaxID=7936 RepID=A0A0E9QGZ8_ANGAN